MVDSSQNINSKNEAISIVIPAFNEEGAITNGIREIVEVMSSTDIKYELIIVDDGSSDKTAELARAEGVQVIQQPENQGYGAALKAGIATSKHDIIVITDADGTYPANQIPILVNQLPGYEMVVGARVGENVSIPLVRKPAKWFLGKLAGYLAGRSIPDLNSGLRVMRKSLIRRFVHLLPQGFSFTTTITLSALCSGSLVKYSKIDYHARIGQSKIRPGHAFDFLLLIVRTIVYFHPLKIFLPAGAIFFVAGMCKFIYDLYIGNLSESALLGIFGAAGLWSVGLLSDQISKVAMRPNSK
ncbi:glycosyltransferase family 2 protein [Cycloclasticus pugetii]|mgnify:CR=1 FL=1|uniref:glycosyltransferase family 2 protein n=1 Tax=Cycloclasticus pugetii TaxID=34068 RepID=UPI0009233087|nr:glycosyltransferase family 2 protein [Cycloclasticus pugetii]SHJ39574.1 Glycosyltransferase involved in cell wall bisynthesis [Cycloclasticus pugetii]